MTSTAAQTEVDQVHEGEAVVPAQRVDDPTPPRMTQAQVLATLIDHYPESSAS